MVLSLPDLPWSKHPPLSPSYQPLLSASSPTPDEQFALPEVDGYNDSDSHRSSSDISSLRSGRDLGELERDEQRPPTTSHGKRSFLARQDPAMVTVAVLAVGSGLALFAAFPFPTTIHPFLSILVGVVGWVAVSWARFFTTLANFLFCSVRSQVYGTRRNYNSLVIDKEEAASSLQHSHSHSHAHAHAHSPTATTFTIPKLNLTLPSYGFMAGPYSAPRALPRWSALHYFILLVLSLVTIFWLQLGIVPPPELVPPIPRESASPKYFIAANLYNNEAILPHWEEQLKKLIDHLGADNTFVSIYESNSRDRTPRMLASFASDLDERGVRNRIVSDVTDRWWPYGTSPERIGLLAAARNRALEPLQSTDASVRLHDWTTFTKVLFLNDIWFSWESAVRLIATRASDAGPDEDGYDLACAMDYFSAGLYDTWVARDVCGTPLRPFWPFVKDAETIKVVRDEEPFALSACWNGMVVFPAGPYLYRDEGSISNHAPTLSKRGWKMVDNATYPNSRMSPPIPSPVKFRTSGIDSCDHSECFLFSYDLHRMYADKERGPRILMNPAVATAYNAKWWTWHNRVLRIPIFRWWLLNWSRGIPLVFVDWIWEMASRHRDYCTWSALATHMPDRCPALPGPAEHPWHMV